MAVRSVERAEFLDDVITTAVEGGTGYWAVVHAYKWVDLKPGEVYAVIEEIEDPQAPGRHRIDADLIARGIGRVLYPGFRIRADLCELIRAADREADAGLIDADGADVIVQAALFGEIVYG